MVSEDYISFEFSQKLVRLQRALYAYILCLLPNRTEAEDVLQETNLILCRKSAEYDESGNFQAWAFQIARYQVMAHMTKARRSKICFSNEMIESLADDATDQTQLKLSQKALQICYDELPAHMKDMAKLRFKEEASLKEICQKMSRPIGSVSATLHRIRKHLLHCVRQKLPALELEAEN